MPPENWLAYVAAYAVICLIPGPSVMMVTAQALARGRKAAGLCILGDLIGGVVVMTASYLGVGLVLATSALGFAVLKWAGVAYMAWLGLAQIRAARRIAAQAVDTSPQNPRTSLRAGLITGLLNPKAILFYMAFLAQFLDPPHAVWLQFLILMATSTLLVGAILGGYALLAAGVATRLRDARAYGLCPAGRVCRVTAR